jgi:hypothetical protein
MDKVLWHPGARRVVIDSAPQGLRFTGGGKKMVWHTTEGGSIEGAEGAYRANGDCPHFTIAYTNGKRVLHQHLPIDRAASALRHPQGTRPTNTADAIQVEIVGFAAQSHAWPKELYHYLHLLAKWCNRHYGVPMTEKATWRNPLKIINFEEYAGHCGHVHVPNNDHVDPGRGFHIWYVLNDTPKVRR